MYTKAHAGTPLSQAEFEAEVGKIDTAIAAFSTEMKERLLEKLRQGWRGWDDPANAREIYYAMLAHGSAWQPGLSQEADIANFAMFLWYHNNGRRPGA